MRRIALLVASALLATMFLLPTTATADGAWLDGPVTQWNTLGMTVPQAPPRNPAIDPRCFEGDNAPESQPEKAVTDAGWWLFGTRAAGLPIEMVLAQSSADGMCRAMQYQVFVFVNGTFAGTMSPVLMDSRLDGSLTARGLQPDDVVFGEYNRYTSSDPLCCPSAKSTATFKIDRSGSAPVLLLQSVNTEQNPVTPAPSPSPSPVPPTPTPVVRLSPAPVQAPAQIPRGQ